MGNKNSLLISTAVCLALATGVATAADDIEVPADIGDTTVVFFGGDFKQDSRFGYIGAIHAPGGLGNDGYAVKGFVGGGTFEWDSNTPGFFSGADGDSVTFDAMLGYRMFSGNWQFGIYGGVNYWDIDQTCRPAAAGPCATFPFLGIPLVQQIHGIGEEWGAKVEGELTHHGDYYADFRGSYSTAFETYWSRARVGIDVGGVTIGPEGALLGNVDYDQTRVGGFALIDMGDYNLSLSGGWSDSDGNSRNSNSAYGAVGVSFTY